MTTKKKVRPETERRYYYRKESEAGEVLYIRDIQPRLKQRFKSACADSKKSMSEVVRKLMDDYITLINEPKIPTGGKLLKSQTRRPGK